MNTIKSFRAKTALITGASSGIGLGFAKFFASQGINLIITARSQHTLNHIAVELREKYQIDVTVMTLDLSIAGHAQQLYDHIQQQNQSVDILINNAGFGKWSHFLSEPLLNYQMMLQLNINALVDLTYLFLPSMLEKNQGIIINVASTAAFQPLPYIAVYAASKAFVLNFTEAIAGEYRGKNVKFLALCPGNTATNFAQVANADTTGMAVSTVDDVVQAAIYALHQNKQYCVPGTKNYCTAQLSRVMSRTSMINLTANILKNRVQKIE